MSLLECVGNNEVNDKVEAVMEDTHSVEDAESDGVPNDILIRENKKGVDWIQGEGVACDEKYSYSPLD